MAGAGAVGAAVHPHVRGEYAVAALQISLTAGSSPRAWGIPFQLFIEEGIFRFIPTCVGNTFLVTPTLLNRAVHPHVRGEYQLELLGGKN